ncbi:hypothetical protein [Streptomyces sp. NEAU-NA10]|uniref:hypothetical protein n=1 Tax=Streptomyces sp. NEAU-NA10 TaxID=3416050 RepID=UPI003CC57C1C
MLIKHLPRDSALNRDLHGEAAEWSVTDHLLAAAVDHLAAANWMFACVNSDEGDQPDPPVPVPRPGDGPEEMDEDGPWDSGTGGADADRGTGPGTGTATGPATDAARRGAQADDRAPSAAQLARFFA